MSDVVVIRKISGDAEAEGILDRLEEVTGLHGEHIEGGRRYDLSTSRDWLIAVASIRGQLADISSSWETLLGLEVDVDVDDD